MPILITFVWIGLGLALQVILFNHLPLFGGVVLSYLYLVLRLPVDWNRNLQILVGFLVGLIVDIFCNTPGLHALACSTTMWMRVPLLHMFIVQDDIKNGCPTYHRLGFSIFSKFLLSMLLLHCVVLFVVESFTLFNFLNLILKIVMSVILSFLVLWVADMANTSK